MKKQTKRIISMILSCLMIFSGMSLSAFAETTHNVQVIKAPAQGGSYGKLYWNNVNYSHDGVNDIPFKINPGSDYTKIEVITDYGEKVFEAKAGAESLTVGDDGSVSFHVNTGNISRVGNNTLTLTVSYADGSWSEDYKVFIQPQVGSYAYDHNDCTVGTTATHPYGGLTALQKTNNTEYTFDVVDGKKCLKISKPKSQVQYMDKALNMTGDSVISYDFYGGGYNTQFNDKIKFYIMLFDASSNYYAYFNNYLSVYDTNDKYTREKWYTIRYIINSANKNITFELVENGTVILSATEDLKEGCIKNDQASYAKYRTQIYCNGDTNDATFFGVDNYRLYRNIPVDSVLKYTENGVDVTEDNFLNGKVSEKAQSVTATLGGAVSGDYTITLYKGDEAISSAAEVNGSEIKFSNLSLESGASYKIKVENASIAGMVLNGYLEIPFETTNLINDIKESCTVTVNNADALKTDKVMIVNATTYPGFTSAAIYVDNAKIADLTENSENTYSVRHLITDDFIGEHKVRLVASYGALDEAVKKEQTIIVYNKNEDPKAYTKDFEEYTALSDAQTAMSASKVVSEIGLKEAHANPKYYIYKDSITNSLALKFNNEGEEEYGVGQSFAYFYADGSGKNYSSGRVSLEFDFYLNSHDNAYMELTPYSIGQKPFTLNGSDKYIIQKGKIAGTDTTIGTGWHHLEAIVDLDNKKIGITIDNIIMGQKDIRFPTDSGHSNLGLYRIGIGTLVNTYWSIDNIKTGYLGSEILKSASYVKGANEFAANKVISCDADSIKLNVRKEYGTFGENDVTVKVNNTNPVSVAAVYSDGNIEVPLTNLSIAEGDTVKVTVSHDARLVDGTYVDELVTIEFVSGNSEGGAIIVENGKAKAYLGIVSDTEVSATVYVVAYKDDALESITSNGVTISAGASSYESASLTLPSSYKEIKCFVWTKDDIKPYITPIIK